jgi:hypothetical protein
MKHKDRAAQVNPIEAIDQQGNVQRWALFKANGLYTLRTETGEVIEFESTLHKSKLAMKRCLKNRGLRAKL